MKSLLLDILVTLVMPWRMVQRVPEQARFGFLGRHALSGLLIYPAIIGTFFLMSQFESPEPEETLPAPQAGLMALMAKGVISEATTTSEWVPRTLAVMGGWLVTGTITGFVTAAMMSGLLVVVLLAGGPGEPGKLRRIWHLASTSTLLLPVAVVGLVAGVMVYADHVAGTGGGETAKIAVALICTCWASGALGLIAWTLLRKWTSAGPFRSAALALIFSSGCWLVVLMSNFVATQPLAWLGIGFLANRGTPPLF